MTASVAVGILLAGLTSAAAVPQGAAAARQSAEPSSCTDVIDDRPRRAAEDPDSEALQWRLLPEIDRAVALFRLHRRENALEKLKWVESLVVTAASGLKSSAALAELETFIRRLLECVAHADPAPLATLTVRTFHVDDTAPGQKGRAAGRGALITVDDVILGRTSRNGALTVPVPSGSIEVAAEIHREPGAAGEAAAELTPGSTATIDILLSDGKQPSHQTDLILLEMQSDTSGASPGSLTFRFLENGRMIPIIRVVDVQLWDSELRPRATWTNHFRAEVGDIVHRSPAILLADLPRDEWFWASVTGEDATGIYRWNRVRLRVTR